MYKKEKKKGSDDEWSDDEVVLELPSDTRLRHEVWFLGKERKEKQNKTYKKLEEWDEDIIVALLADTSITKLILKEFELEDAEAQILADLLRTNTTIKTLKFKDLKFENEKGQEVVFEALRQNTSIRFFRMGGLPEARKLYTVTARDVEFLSDNKGITKVKLWLDGSGEGMNALSQMLTRNSTLTSLWIAHLTLDQEAMQIFSDALRVNRTLQRLDGKVDLTEKRQCLRILAEGLAYNATLATLEWKINDANTKVFTSLLPAFEKNTSLTRAFSSHVSGDKDFNEWLYMNKLRKVIRQELAPLQQEIEELKRQVNPK